MTSEPLTVAEGELQGHRIRKARKAFSCDGWSERKAHTTINAGDYYVEGWPNLDIASGFGCDRYCLGCIGAIDVSRPQLQPLIDATVRFYGGAA